MKKYEVEIKIVHQVEAEDENMAAKLATDGLDNFEFNFVEVIRVGEIVEEVKEDESN